MINFVPLLQIRELYDHFDTPVTDFDCGSMCAPHNPSGKPFCCDICHAVPAVYHQEWHYLQRSTDLWHEWRGDECAGNLAADSAGEHKAGLEIDPSERAALLEDTPDHMLLLACQGPNRCQREYRAVSCRQFPFFPYISSDDRFTGLAYEWEFEPVCWVISNLGSVTERYRDEFVATYDDLFARWQDELEGYAAKSEEMRLYFAALKRRIPILHRRGGYYLLSPGSERLQRVDPGRFRRFGPYRQNG